MRDRKFVVSIIAALFVGVMFGVFMERRVEQAELARLENLIADTVSRVELQQMQGIVSDLDERLVSFTKAATPEIQILQGQVADMQEKKLTTTDLADLAIAVDELAARITILEPTQYVDESEVPHFDGGSKEMSLKYPRIIIDGEKLYYNADLKTYCYHGTMQRAMWLGAGPERMLMTPEKEFNGVPHEFVGGQWRPKEVKENKG